MTGEHARKIANDIVNQLEDAGIINSDANAQWAEDLTTERLQVWFKDTQQVYPFNRGEVYWSIDNSDDGRLVLNVSVWDDVSEEDYTEDAIVYGSSYEAMVQYIEMHIAERFPLVKDTYRAAEWTLQWMSNNGFRMPMEVGDHVFVKDIEIGITEWMNR